MQECKVVLKFFDGSETPGKLSGSFNPRERELRVDSTGEGQAVAFRLQDLCFIKFFCEIGHYSREQRTLEEVTTSTGDVFRVHIPDTEIFTSGFFGFPADPGTDWQAVFFTLGGIRRRQLSERVGEILIRNGAVPEHEVKAALAEQERLRKRRVGEILAESNNLPQDVIEKTLAENANREGLPKQARVGDILVAAGLVTRQQVEQAVADQKQGQHKKIGDLLIERGLITENQLMAALAAKFRMRMVDLGMIEPEEEALSALSSGMAHRLRVLPLERSGNDLTVATSSPTDHTILDGLRFATGCNVELVVAYEADIAAALDRYYPPGDTVGSILGQLSSEVTTVEEEDFGSEVKESDSQVINLVNKLLVEAYRHKISDLHFEPGAGSAPLRVRHRIDGVCQVAYMVSGSFKRAVIARLKILAHLDIAERRKPQSGKIQLRAGRQFMEFRLEVTPTVGGMEDAVLRVLGAAKPLPLEQMDFSAPNLASFEKLLASPYGMILCVGPTGSGKTTTLHSALAVVNKPERKIWTVEDPVEITQHGLRQVPVNPKIGFSFAEALRSFLRADPDVIMVGEMRDVETAEIALRASLTGHLMFSTLHTNNAPETITRLIDMGMDPLNFSDALLGVLAQRLVRRLCPDCRRQYHPTREEYQELADIYGRELFAKDGFPDWNEKTILAGAQGCEQCGGTGYRGRMALHELLVVSDVVKKAMKKTGAAEVLREIAIPEGMRTLKMDGIAKVLAGQTDLKQILRVCL